MVFFATEWLALTAKKGALPAIMGALLIGHLLTSTSGDKELQ
jgi:Kef-type K+ transport system membrane component KefB